jgi:hypothetical protein
MPLLKEAVSRYRTEINFSNVVGIQLSLRWRIWSVLGHVNIGNFTKIWLSDMIIPRHNKAYDYLCRNKNMI